MKFTRHELISRHRLSSRQADDFLGEKPAEKDIHAELVKLKQLGYFLKLAEEMQQNGLFFLMMKGPMLSERLFGDPFCRTSKDVDLLADEREADKVIRFLLEKGFTGQKYEWPASTEKQQRIQKIEDQYALYHAGYSLSIEVHWRLFTEEFISESIIQKYIKNNLTQYHINGFVYTTFDKELELLYLVIHGGKHAWFRLKWLVDIREYIRKNHYNHQKFIQMAGELKAGRFVAICNGVLKKIYGNDVCLPGTWKPRPGLVSQALYQLGRKSADPRDSAINKFRLVLYKLSLSGRVKYKKDVLRNLLLRNKELM